MKMYKIAPKLVLLLLIISACQEKKEKVSEDIIPYRKFVNMLIDIHKTDAYLATFNLNDEIFGNKIDSLSYYNYVFKKYGVTRQEFLNTMYYYSNNFERFLKLQKEVIDKLQAEFDELDSLSRKNLKTRDLWFQSREVSLPKQKEDNPLKFAFTTSDQGVYNIEAEYYIYNDNTSYDFVLYIIGLYKDGSSDTVRNYIVLNRVERKKWLKYSLGLTTKREKELKEIRGDFLYINQAEGFTHVDIRDIKLIYEAYDEKENKK